MKGFSVSFGDPAVQQAFLEEYTDFLIEHRELMPVIDAIMLNRTINASIADETAAVAHLEDTDPLVLAVEDSYKANIACFVLARLAIDEFNELLVLAVAGYGLGCMKILRSMYEHVVSSAYVAENPQVSRALVDSKWIHDAKVWKMIRKIDPTVVQRADPHRMEEMEKNAAAAQARFKESFCSKCKQLIKVNAWTKVPLSDMAEKVGSDLSSLYLQGYQIPTALAHTTGHCVNEKMVQGEDGAWTYQMDSSNERRQALRVGHNLLLLLLARQDKHFCHGLEHLLLPRFDAFNRVWSAKSNKSALEQDGPASS